MSRAIGNGVLAQARKLTAAEDRSRNGTCREFRRSMLKRGPKAQSKLSRVLERTRLSRAYPRDSSRHRSLSLQLSVCLFSERKYSRQRVKSSGHLCPCPRPSNEVVGVVLKRKREIFRRAAYRQRACTTRCALPPFHSPSLVSYVRSHERVVGIYWLVCRKFVSSRDLPAA